MHAKQGVDLFHFNDHATKIKEVQGEQLSRSWSRHTHSFAAALHAGLQKA
jgi:hypothetical protein